MDIMTEEKWNDDLFPYRNDGYKYKYFLRAVAQFPKFCAERKLENAYANLKNETTACKRELAALFAHITYESGLYFDKVWD